MSIVPVNRYYCWYKLAQKLCCIIHCIHYYDSDICFISIYQTWRRQWQPSPVLLLGKYHGRGSLVGCSPWGRYKSDTTERLHFHFSLSCTGEENGNSLQCSCLENPRLSSGSSDLSNCKKQMLHSLPPPLQRCPKTGPEVQVPLDFFIWMFRFSWQFESSRDFNIYKYEENLIFYWVHIY